MTQSELLDRLAVRETIERYMAHLDQGDWAGVASCFTDDAESVYNDDPTVLRGGVEVAGFIQRALTAYEGTVHDLANCQVFVQGDSATAITRALVGMVRPVATVTFRAVEYTDELRRVSGTWLIVRRKHVPLWQSDIPAKAPKLTI